MYFISKTFLFTNFAEGICMRNLIYSNMNKIFISTYISQTCNTLSKLILTAEHLTKKRGMMVNETTLCMKSQDTEINIYISPYGLQQ